MDNFYTNNDVAFNRFVNLDNVEWNMIMYLVNSQTKYARNIWKILKYDTEDCLLQDNVSREDRLALIYTNNGDASVKRVFMTPYTDDGWTEQSSHLHIFVDTVEPKNHITAVVNISVETIIHNKIANIIGDADPEKLIKGPDGKDNNCDKGTNPVEVSSDGEILVPYKNRATVFLKSVLAEFNGVFVNGVGKLQFNQQLSPYGISRQYLWNNRNFFGHSTVFSTHMSGASESAYCGY